ncbi:putative long-chain-fatty-acid--CoA ligase [Nymphon striatum]|nr:putative long-chain-fatty-acid--CoA ligase [Nymphon striatum]
MMAAEMCGAVPVPLYQDANAEEMAYVMSHCGARFAIVGDQEQVDKIFEVQEQLPEFEQMIYLDPRGLRKYDHKILKQYTNVQEIGRQTREKHIKELEARQAKLDYDSTGVMLYTSGTTGKPKGVVLSNRNVIETAKSSSEFDDLRQTDDILAYLPMAWVGDFIFSVGQALWTGFCTNCPESADTMHLDLREIGPTYYFAPPRVFETQLTSVMIRMEDASRMKKWLFHTFMAHARKVGPAILDGKELYGQTEATVFITAQPDGEVRSDTVGVTCPGVELKIAENGEVFYRSPGVFVEYYKNPESTADTKDAEGWVATGDAGFIEESSGHLRIIDRAKDVGQMADGSLFAPKGRGLGNGKDECTAFINIDLTAVGNWAERNNIGYASYQELAQHPQVLEQIQDHVEEVNKSVAQDEMLSGCQVHRFVVLHKELDADDGELTRTRKVRRRIIEEKYADIIAALYDGSPQVSTETEVTYEDGRKGSIKATLGVRDAKVQAVMAKKMAAE